MRETFRDRKIVFDIFPGGHNTTRMSSRERKQPRRYASLKAWREAHGYTLEQAAEVLDLPLTSYFHFERGDRMPRRETLQHLRERTGVPLSSLVGVA